MFTNRKKALIITIGLGILSFLIVGNGFMTGTAYHELGLDRTGVLNINDTRLSIEKVAGGLHLPTHMAFLGLNDILVLEKNNGTVRRIINGNLLPQPILDVNVANTGERGMLGIALSKNLSLTYVFLFFTETHSSDRGEIFGNMLYRYEFRDNKLVNPKLLLALPYYPSPYLHGGSIAIGPDSFVYLSTGDMHGACEEEFANLSCPSTETQAENYPQGADPDGRAGILRVTQDGKTAGDHGILGNYSALDKYYAYGIRNSFGIDFDPLTGKLWDTENGHEWGDEINLVAPGFNSGWNKIQGIWTLDQGEKKGKLAPKEPDNLANFGGKGKYTSPQFIWDQPVGPTAIKFLNSNKYGENYKNDLFVADSNFGNIYHFKLNENRTGLLLEGPLIDKVADNYNELHNAIFAKNLGIITDLKIGPDGLLYILTYGSGKIFKIIPQQNGPIQDYDTGIGISKIGCFHYDKSIFTVIITCKSANIADLYEVLVDSDLMAKDGPKDWTLNTNLDIKDGSTFYINSTDTESLKINSTGVPHRIISEGNLIIDSVKITGWNKSSNDYAKSERNGTIPRSFILVRNPGGALNITDSEIAYLGYNQPDSFGLTYYSGSGSVLQNNKIHDLFTGFYAKDNIHDVTIENNEIYNSTAHGIDSHNNTNKLLIKNNSIHHNAKKGIFCSTDCYNIVIESNKIYNSPEEGIMIYNNATNSIIKNNILYNNRDQVAIYDSSKNNEIYNNTMTGGKVGIRVTSNSTQNMVHNNNIMNSNYGIYILKGASDNVISSNRIGNTSDTAILIQDPDTNNNIFKNNILFENQKNEVNQLNIGSSNSSFINNTVLSTK